MSSANDYSRMGAVTPDAAYDYAALGERLKDTDTWFLRARGQWSPPPHPDECPSVFMEGRAAIQIQTTAGWINVYSGTPVAYHRETLIQVLIHHQRLNIQHCMCGWGELGRSHADHVLDVYEASIEATRQETQ